MSKTRDLADFVSAGNPLADGTIDVSDINGVTATAAELNYTDGVTSNIQTQLDAKAPTASPTFTGTATYATLSDGTTTLTSTVAELNILDGVTATTAEINYLDGVTSNIQTQFDGLITDLVSDTTPQLGGNLDLNSNDITGTGNVNVTGTVTATSFSGDGSSLTGISTYDVSTSSTGFFALPSGTTAQRPGSPAAGYARFNSDKASFEYYTGTDWLAGDIKPVISGLSGTVYKDIASNLTLTVAETTDTFSVRYLNGSTIVATVADQTQSGGSCTTAVPSSVYGITSGTTITVRLVNSNGVESSTSQSFTIQELPSGGTVSTVGTYTVHKFTSSGTFNVGTFSGDLEYLVVAGGGGGGGRGSRWGGSGGAGGLRSSISGVNSGGGASTESVLTVNGGSITVTVGGGGNGYANSAGANGGTSSIVYSGGGTISTVGGGGGGTNVGQSGGSGGGGSNGAGGGSGTAGQGYAGGGSTDQGLGGGGGGAAGAGAQDTYGPGLTFTDKVQSGSIELARGARRDQNNSANTGWGGKSGFDNGGLGSGASGVVYIRYEL